MILSNEARTRLKRTTVLAVLVAIATSGCAVWTVDPQELQRGDPDGMQFRVDGRVGYERVWEAATTAMSQGMTIVDSHKPSGTLRSRIGSAPTGKVMAMFITPTAEHAPQYVIEMVARKPMGMGLRDRRHPEYSTVAEAFGRALGLPPAPPGRAR